MIKKIIIISVILGVFLPIPSINSGSALSEVEVPSFSFAQNQPETFEEVQEMGKRAVEVGQKELPGILEKIWKEEILPIWQKMYDWFKTNVWPKIESWFKKEVEPKVKEEIEKRKPIIEEEFKKEKEEMKEELPKVTKSLWEKFKELIK